MSFPGDDARRYASMLTERADHWSVTTERLAGTADAVADLSDALVTALAEGERPKFCFDADETGVGFGDPEATVSPERGGVYLLTDRRVYLRLGVGDEDESLSLPYADIVGVRHRHGRRRHRIDLAVSGAKYYLWIPSLFDADDVIAATEYVNYRHTAETPDSGGGGSSSGEPQSIRDRLERLGDAKSRGLIDEEEFQRRKEELLGE
ncbi:SHOCT domain-containing protein [Halorussus gelatinilyticus]|uniref:SHOCT domain-containing protein n=1 Tax=Halorussus gelatinilyticus TaxID=2937524 RepID=A0A8U0IEW2_9EURY|nr:SHOCT domain-containing protein [Halorussus gelatinilyticus]UPV99512.1 SHOCT domain-containing protein [Halorussus gelatinilyticus]